MQAHEIDNFETLLEEAERGAVTEWEMAFVADMIDKYGEYDEATYVSDKQLEILQRLAK
jgi:hypothetical protein